ncbi:MAG: hypothetical protein ACF8XB_18765 [Planctomycetota bacterium JB042]
MPVFLWTLLRAGVGKALAVSGVIGAASAIADTAKKVEQEKTRRALGLATVPAEWPPPEWNEPAAEVAAETVASTAPVPETKTAGPALSTTLGTTLGVLAAAALLAGVVSAINRRS